MSVDTIASDKTEFQWTQGSERGSGSEVTLTRVAPPQDSEVELSIPVDDINNCDDFNLTQTKGEVKTDIGLIEVAAVETTNSVNNNRQSKNQRVVVVPVESLPENETRHEGANKVGVMPAQRPELAPAVSTGRAVSLVTETQSTRASMSVKSTAGSGSGSGVSSNLNVGIVEDTRRGGRRQKSMQNSIAAAKQRREMKSNQIIELSDALVCDSAVAMVNRQNDMDVKSSPDAINCDASRSAKSCIPSNSASVVNANISSMKSAGVRMVVEDSQLKGESKTIQPIFTDPTIVNIFASAPIPSSIPFDLTDVMSGFEHDMVCATNGSKKSSSSSDVFESVIGTLCLLKLNVHEVAVASGQDSLLAAQLMDELVAKTSTVFSVTGVLYSRKNSAASSATASDNMPHGEQPVIDKLLLPKPGYTTTYWVLLQLTEEFAHRPLSLLQDTMIWAIDRLKAELSKRFLFVDRTDRLTRISQDSTLKVDKSSIHNMFHTKQDKHSNIEIFQCQCPSGDLGYVSSKTLQALICLLFTNSPQYNSLNCIPPEDAILWNELRVRGAVAVVLKSHLFTKDSTKSAEAFTRIFEIFYAKGLRLVAMRTSYLTDSESALTMVHPDVKQTAQKHFTTIKQSFSTKNLHHLPCRYSQPVFLVLVLCSLSSSEVDTVDLVRDALGPEDPTLARKTDPASVRALLARDKANNIAYPMPYSPDRLWKDLCFWMGPRQLVCRKNGITTRDIFGGERSTKKTTEESREGSSDSAFNIYLPDVRCVCLGFDVVIDCSDPQVRLEEGEGEAAAFGNSDTSFTISLDKLSKLQSSIFQSVNQLSRNGLYLTSMHTPTSSRYSQIFNGMNAPFIQQGIDSYIHVINLGASRSDLGSLGEPESEVSSSSSSAFRILFVFKSEASNHQLHDIRTTLALQANQWAIQISSKLCRITSNMIVVDDVARHRGDGTPWSWNDLDCVALRLEGKDGFSTSKRGNSESDSSLSDRTNVIVDSAKEEMPRDKYPKSKNEVDRTTTGYMSRISLSEENFRSHEDLGLPDVIVMVLTLPFFGQLHHDGNDRSRILPTARSPISSLFGLFSELPNSTLPFILGIATVAASKDYVSDGRREASGAPLEALICMRGFQLMENVAAVFAAGSKSGGGAVPVSFPGSGSSRSLSSSNNGCKILTGRAALEVVLSHFIVPSLIRDSGNGGEKASPTNSFSDFFWQQVEKDIAKVVPFWAFPSQKEALTAPVSLEDENITTINRVVNSLFPPASFPCFSVLLVSWDAVRTKRMLTKIVRKLQLGESRSGGSSLLRMTSFRLDAGTARSINESCQEELGAYFLDKKEEGEMWSNIKGSIDSPYLLLLLRGQGLHRAIPPVIGPPHQAIAARAFPRSLLAANAAASWKPDSKIEPIPTTSADVLYVLDTALTMSLVSSVFKADLASLLHDRALLSPELEGVGDASTAASIHPGAMLLQQQLWAATEDLLLLNLSSTMVDERKSLHLSPPRSLSLPSSVVSVPVSVTSTDVICLVITSLLIKERGLVELLEALDKEGLQIVNAYSAMFSATSAKLLLELAGQSSLSMKPTLACLLDGPSLLLALQGDPHATGRLKHVQGRKSIRAIDSLHMKSSASHAGASNSVSLSLWQLGNRDWGALSSSSTKLAKGLLLRCFSSLYSPDCSIIDSSAPAGLPASMSSKISDSLPEQQLCGSDEVIDLESLD